MAGTYAEQFVREGFVALAFDYAHYGESAGNTAYLAARDPRVKGLATVAAFLPDLARSHLRWGGACRAASTGSCGQAEVRGDR